MSHETGTPDPADRPTEPISTGANGTEPTGTEPTGTEPTQAIPAPAPYVSGYEVPSSTAPVTPAAPAAPGASYPAPASPYAAPASPYPAPGGAPASPYAAPASPYSAPGSAAPQQPYGTPAPAPSPYGSTPQQPAASTPYGAPAPGYATPAAPPAYAGATYGGYPPAPGYPGQTPYATPYPGPAPTRPTDGVSIAALVTGLLGLAVVPLVLGILGVGRTKKNGTGGKGMAIAGIALGAAQIVLYAVIGIIVFFGVSAYQDRMADLRSDCAGGDMAACDTLYDEAVDGSDDQHFGDTCGGTTSGGQYCDSSGLPDTDVSTYGDDPELDALWDGCAAGDMAACDDLYVDSPWDSDNEEFGQTCGHRVETTWSCESETF
jgi:hypothetical protein